MPVSVTDVHRITQRIAAPLPLWIRTAAAWNSTNSAKVSKTPPRAYLAALAGRLREGRLRTLEHDRDNVVIVPVAAQAPYR